MFIPSLNLSTTPSIFSTVQYVYRNVQYSLAQLDTRIAPFNMSIERVYVYGDIEYISSVHNLKYLLRHSSIRL